MFGLEGLGNTIHAVETVAIVLAEAIALYVAYGALSTALRSTVMGAVGDE